VTPPGRFANIIECWRSLEITKERAESLDHILVTHETELLTRMQKTPVFGLGK
jgi:predicted MPP superfamily phosphohydrolase